MAPDVKPLLKTAPEKRKSQLYGLYPEKYRQMLPAISSDDVAV
jgi:hypothetical protein